MCSDNQSMPARTLTFQVVRLGRNTPTTLKATRMNQFIPTMQQNPNLSGQLSLRIGENFFMAQALSSSFQQSPIRSCTTDILETPDFSAQLTRSSTIMIMNRRLVQASLLVLVVQRILKYIIGQPLRSFPILRTFPVAQSYLKSSFFSKSGLNESYHFIQFSSISQALLQSNSRAIRNLQQESMLTQNSGDLAGCGERVLSWSKSLLQKASTMAICELPIPYFFQKSSFFKEFFYILQSFIFHYQSFMGVSLHFESVTPPIQELLLHPPKLLSLSLQVLPHALLRLWAFSLLQDNQIAINGLSVNKLLTSRQNFKGNQCYLLLLLKKQNLPAQETIPQSVNESLNAAPLTPRGMSFSLYEQHAISSQVSFSLHLWNGKKASSILRAKAFKKSIQLQASLKRCQQSHLLHLLSGQTFAPKRQSKINLLNFNQVGRSCSLFSENSLLSALIQSKFKKFKILSAKKNQEKFIAKNPHFPVKVPIQQNDSSYGIIATSEPQSQLTANKLFLNLSPIAAIQSSPNEQAKPSMSLKLPLINLQDCPPRLQIKKLENRNYTYQDVEREEQYQYNFDIGNTERYQLKMQRFQKDCSQVEEGLFVSGESVSSNRQQLKENGVTHIINCAADYCHNCFEDQFQYTTFFLKDSQNQNIECIFYQCIRVIQQAKDKGGKVLVHCVQGISRSVTVVIAYLIFTRRMDYGQAQKFIKSKRAIANPNYGFIVQLIVFYKRLYEPFQSVSQGPRVFMIGSHQKQSPSKVVCRFLNYQLYDKKKQIGLDPRGLFIVQNKQEGVIWVGGECSGRVLQVYLEKALQYCQYLRKYQRLLNSKVIKQGQEDSQFWESFRAGDCWFIKGNPDWDGFFLSVDQVGKKPGYYKVLNVAQQEQDQQEKKDKCKLFIYPDCQNGLGVFDYDDLTDTNLAVLVKQSEDQLKAYTWKGNQFKMDEFIINDFQRRVIKRHYQGTTCTSSKEFQGRESDQFDQCFR